MSQKSSCEKIVPKNESNNGTGNGQEKKKAEISIKEFLDFLRTAYQVSDSVENILSAEGLVEEVDWIKLKNSELVKPKAVSCQTSHLELGDAGDAMKEKLDEVLNEGLLDSVLPYMVPNNKKSNARISDKSNSSSSKTSISRGDRRRSTENVVKPHKTDSEVEIHVCDEVKNVKKDFICNQKLLVEKMGYFAEVTSGTKLEDMDISVHCDIQIFEWLMRWVKKEQSPEEDWPKLDVECVVPVLVSAAFLQMEPLLQDCLFYCHEHMNEIIQNNTNLNCINDSILTRLAAMYTNSELEAIKDKKDKIQSRLYCKMIISLGEPICESVRGHWNSLARIYRCTKCQQLIMPEISKSLPCHPSCMTLTRYGDLISHHQRDTNWDINNYIIDLQSRLKTWRKVYWKLWGDCHYLFCTICNKPFPAHQMRWCCFHPDEPQFFTVDSQKAPLPIGRYPCCGERVYRFELLENHTGCQFKEHTPKTTQARDAAVYAILDTFRDVIDTEPPELIFPERLTRLVARDPSIPEGKLNCKEQFWWEGLQIIPPHHQQGLLDHVKTPSTEDPNPQVVNETIEESSEDMSSSESVSASSHSEESHPKPQRSVAKVNKKKLPTGKLWQNNLSARSNQDVQRANEEKYIHKMIDYLGKKSTYIASTSKVKGFTKHVSHPAGVYIRLEAEWREANLYNKRLPSYINKPKINKPNRTLL